MEYFREYRDVFYANTGPDHPPKTNSQSPVSLFRTRAILLFSAAVFPVFKVETARFSLPFQSKIGCRRHLVVSRQERGHKMMLNCFSKEFIKIWDDDAVETEWWEYMNYLPECRILSGCYSCTDLQLRILYEGVTDGRAGVLSNSAAGFYLSPDKMDPKQISWPDFPLVQPQAPKGSPRLATDFADLPVIAALFSLPKLPCFQYSALS